MGVGEPAEGQLLRMGCWGGTGKREETVRGVHSMVYTDFKGRESLALGLC